MSLDDPPKVKFVISSTERHSGRKKDLWFSLKGKGVKVEAKILKSCIRIFDQLIIFIT